MKKEKLSTLVSDIVAFVCDLNPYDHEPVDVEFCVTIDDLTINGGKAAECFLLDILTIEDDYTPEEVKTAKNLLKRVKSFCNR